MIKLPDELIEMIKEYIRKNSLAGERGWRFSNQEEDSLLGHYLGRLVSEKQFFLRENKIYEWEIRYNKFRGRGKNALESLVGADSIITFEIENKDSNEKTIKSILLQAKKEGNNQGLERQKYLMDKFAKDGNFIFTCTPDGYFAQRDLDSDKMRIGDFLSDVFISCFVGIEDMYYEDNRNELIRDDKAINFDIKDELSINVEIEKNNRFLH